MKHFTILFSLGLASMAVACGSDSNAPAGMDSGAGGSTTTGAGGHSGGGASNGGAAGSGAGGMETGAGGSASGGAGMGGTPSSDGGKGPAGGMDGGGGGPDGGSTEAGTAGDGGLHIEHVFVIAMENHDETQIIGDVADAPYINDTLVKNYASSSNFVDTLAIEIVSEPHYVLMEAATNVFTDATFTNDDNPSAANSTSSTEHLVTQMKNAAPNISWMSYQEDMDATSGDCPVAPSGFYAPKHDPFVFFQDVSGSPPSKTNAYCKAHHAPMTQLATDLSNDTVASYNFVTPNLCNDMHGAGGCSDSNTIRSGDNWLKANLPALETYVNGHRGVVFIVWDEGSATLKIPFIAIGPSVKKGYVGGVKYTHASVVKSVERIFGLPILNAAKNANDFSDLFESGRFP